VATLISPVMPRSDSLFFRSLEPEVSASQRARMLDAVSRSVARKGYARVTVADVVALAGVSRRTFYEHFTDKEACFLAAYSTGTDVVIGDIVAAIAGMPDADWRERLRVALEAYTATLAAEPEISRALLVDVLGAGPRAVELRQRVYDRFGDQWRFIADQALAQDAGIGPVSDLVLRALVGGIGELVQRQILTEGAETLPDLTPTLATLAIRVIEGAGARAQSSRVA
jgi:AcrR family transcriptional regulator